MQSNDLKEKYIPRLLLFYQKEIIPQLMDKFGYKNQLAVPKLIKISVNMGVGEAITNAKIIEKAAEELSMITGQKPKICRAKKSISNFKLRQGQTVGCHVTMRRYRMYEFLDRLITASIPRIRDFRGFSFHSFDGRGNYNFGLTEQTVFPEINLDRVSRTQGMDIAINTTANTDEEARELLTLFGFPFKK